MSEQYDLIVVGGGPAGYTAALEAAKLKMRTALVENRELGGTCLNQGCIPTKSLLHSAGLYARMKSAETFGVSAGEARYDMGRIQDRKNQVVETLRGGIGTLMRQNWIRVVNAAGSLTDGHTVVAGGEELRGSHILIATGSVPARLPIPGADLEGVVTSDELLDRREPLESLVIVGGGVIGMEFASVYSDLGCRVTVLEFMDSVLPGMDREVSRSLKMILAKRGVEIHTGARVERVERTESGKLVCQYTEKDAPGEAVGDCVLIAAGRRPNTAGLFTGEFAVETDRGRVTVDEFGRTSVPTVYAAGDVTGGIMLAHAASAQGVNAVRHMAGLPPLCDLSAVPACVYTEPEIACVGLTQDEAKRRGIDVTVKKVPMSANGRTVIADLDRGFIKAVAERDTGRILGAQLMCANATDLVSQFTAAIVRGLTVSDLAGVIWPHPTFSEAVGELMRLF